MTITPTSASGTAVSGTLYLNTFQATPNNFPYDSSSFPFTPNGGDQVAALPYSYTVM